ncbi:MAG TPA: multicopper oxidase domain-containing protein, partial [Rhodothermales bacterium]|nr:multicopper oxidase domain-containing protein [Rhodothermales bacterium]
MIEEQGLLNAEVESSNTFINHQSLFDIRYSLFLLLFLLVLPSRAQDHSMHHGHQMAESDSLMWRMPPMDMSMPMMPGLENALPPVMPFLAGEGKMIDMLPEARPGEIVEMADGDTLHMEATLVRRTINGRDFVMYGYNGQYPGPLIRAERGATVIVQFTNNIELPTTVHWHG